MRCTSYPHPVPDGKPSSTSWRVHNLMPGVEHIWRAVVWLTGPEHPSMEYGPMKEAAQFSPLYLSSGRSISLQARGEQG